MRLVPAIDLRDGRCVRLLQGRFDAETIYDTDPLRVLAYYRDLGARYVHIVDLDGARHGESANGSLLQHLVKAHADMELQVGGGARSAEVVKRLLDLGVRRVIVGSLAVTDPEIVRSWLKEYGADRVVLAFDVSIDPGGVPRLATHGWETHTATSLWDAVDAYGAHGAMHVLCTDIARDGALCGPNLALYAQAVRRYPSLRWQASGGVSSAADLLEVARTGVAAIVSGRALLERRIAGAELEPFLRDA